MTATRAATIRGRAWVGGVVSLGRVQTPTLTMIVKREREIQVFVPEPYWLVRAAFEPPYDGPWFEGDETRVKEGAPPHEILERVSGKDGGVEAGGREGPSERAPPPPPPRPFPPRPPPAGALCADDDRPPRRGRALPHARQGEARGRVARRLRPRGGCRQAAGGGRRGRGAAGGREGPADPLHHRGER